MVYRAFFLNTEVRALFSWLSSVALPHDVIAVIGKKPTYYRFDFPLRVGDIPRRIKSLEKEHITFCMFIDGAKAALDTAEWVVLFNGPYCALYEQRERSAKTPPLRLGVLEKEKQALGMYLFGALHTALTGEPRVQKETVSLERLEREKADVGVALWCKGELRGSQVVTGDFALRGMKRALQACLTDVRFKPLSLRELEEVTIQMTLLSPVRVPLTKRELLNPYIQYDKAYCAKQGGREAWFLPEVHNVRRYADQRVLLHDLLVEKMGGARSAGTTVYVCSVVDFLYKPSEGGKLIDLYASMPKQSTVCTNGELQKAAEETANALLRMQDEDGNIAPIVRFDSGSSRQVDWARLAFTCYALAAFGRAVSSDGYRTAAEKGLLFIERAIARGGGEFPYPTLLFSYCGLAALALGNTQLADSMMRRILALGAQNKKLQLDPISCAQMISFFEELPIARERKEALCSKAKAYVKREYSKAKKTATFNFAEWAELVFVFRHEDTALVADFVETVLCFQNEDGSFASNYTMGNSYTRGTAKLFEVLALARGAQKSCEAAVRYLKSMQYTGDEWFLTPSRRDLMKGLFRHDYGNPDAWIDSSGHFLLGVARSIENHYA